MNIEIEEKSIVELFNDLHWFNIPSYQRPYVWTEENISEFLDDITYAFENNISEKYFLGSLVLQKKIGFDYDVLDGQQRLTTICILLAILRDNIKDKELFDNLSQTLHKSGDKSLNIANKNRLQFEVRGEVQEFFSKYIANKKGTLELQEINSKNISIKNMINTVKVIKEFIQTYFDNELDSEDLTNTNLNKFIGFIRQNLIFAYVCSDTREQAFKLFTILNNRGIPLTTADILKSLNLDKVDEKDRKEYAKKWEELEEKHGDKFDRFLNFIRTIKLKEKARKNLLEEFEEKISKKGLMTYGKESIDYIKATSDNYDKLISFDITFEKLDNKYKNLVTIMKTGFNSEDWIPPLLYYYEKFNIQDLDKFVTFLDSKFMGDWINRETPTKRLENMNKILKAIEIANTSNEIIQNNQLFEFDREKFFNEINRDIFGQRYCKYLLLKIENYKIDSNMVFISSYRNISVEHILPQNPKADSQWRKEFTDEEREYWTNKLANLMLITRRKNSQLSNSEFEKKKSTYSKEELTIFPSNNYIYLTTEKWNISELEKRQYEINNIFGNHEFKSIPTDTIIQEIYKEEKIIPTQAKEKVIDFILNSERNLCDDCLSEELKIAPRQAINKIVNSLKDNKNFIREKTKCDICNGTKLILMKKQEN
ncbi:DUF262 domain-containing protein [Fusobacterium varium]|uniref:DUF262 domain-containing protein n=1 Tax=Fusobacterium varium TaxID=856 RepID=UPI00241C5701|nr:DUF262 domain-containing HNH endonuclease family protein [Fusobacterium varium]